MTIQIDEDVQLIRLADLAANELDGNAEFKPSWSKEEAEAGPKNIIWFIPAAKNLLSGGVRTIFSIAESFSIAYDTKHIFVIDDFKCKEPPEYIDFIFNQTQRLFPKLNLTSVINYPREYGAETTAEFSSLPPADFGVATIWTTAYLLAKYNKCKKKIYLVQDFEPRFYPAGTMSAIVEQTYRLGFVNVCNSEEVYWALSEGDFGDMQGRLRYFVPGVDKDIFTPKEKMELKPPYKIVFYGRTNDRNCFVLAAEILSKVKEVLGRDVIVQSVGENWTENPELFRYLDAGIECLGKLQSLEALSQLYKDSHLGLCFMATPHPSYSPFEYMSSGCVPVMLQTKYRHPTYGDTSLMVPPSIIGAADEIISLLKDRDRYMELRKKGIEYSSYLYWGHTVSEAMDIFNEVLVDE